MKIYVHHYFTEPLFYLLAHNTTDRIFELKDNCGSIKCKYKNVDFEFIFKKEITDESDGYHLIDWITLFIQSDTNENLFDLFTSKRNVSDEINNKENNTLYNLSELIKNKKNWILSFFCGEKSLYKYESLVYGKNIQVLNDLENSLNKFNDTKIIFEEVFLKKEIENKYPNFYFAFSNVMWYWNNHADIRWFYEFKKIYNHLNFDYDICYSMRTHRYNRILLLNELKKLNKKNIFLQRSDARKESIEYEKYENKVLDIYLNSLTGNNDFDNLNLVNKQRVGLDLFFRLLPKAKMQILDESWGWSPNNFSSNYISEKSIGYILAGIPFVSTHSFPLEIIQKILNVKPHPFFKESEMIKGDAVLFAKFINKFLEEFDTNYQLCKEWVDECHSVFMKKLYNENSMLDLILNNFEKNITTKQNLI